MYILMILGIQAVAFRTSTALSLGHTKVCAFVPYIL